VSSGLSAAWTTSSGKALKRALAKRAAGEVDRTDDMMDGMIALRASVMDRAEEPAKW